MPISDNLNVKNLDAKSNAKAVAETSNTSLKKPKHFKQICIVGLGLIGASLAQAIRDNDISERLIAVDSHSPSIEAALQANVIDAGSTQLDAVVAGSDCIVIAVPVKAVGLIFAAIYQAMQQKLIEPNCIITDVCSTKQSVVDSAVEVFGILPKGFVPAHPIAGTENSGFHARVADLFVNRSVIVCEVESTCPDAVKKVKNLWSAVGAQVMTMDVAHHDTVLAHTSHLPHLLAFNLVKQLADNDDNMDIFRYAASGFRDFTRIAASDPTMWHDIFFANKTALIDALDGYTDYLKRLRDIIVNEKSTELLGLLGQAQSARRHFDHMLNSTPYSNKIGQVNAPSDANLLADALQSNVVVNTSLSYVITPASTIYGTIVLPGDKSISHRSIMLGSLANGVTRITGFLEGEDALATLQAFRDMGVVIEGPDKGRVVIHGVGLHGLKPSRTPLYMGNSGTSMRLLAGILAAQPFDSVMTGDKSLSKRPMQRVAQPLRDMGAIIQTTGENRTAPISITGRDKVGTGLKGINYHMPVASAQVKSCLLLAGLWATGTTRVIQPKVTRDHTERMLSVFGYDLQVNDNEISLQGGGYLQACEITVPADISSAAFFMVAVVISNGGELTLKQVGINPTRTGIIDILKLMGASISLSNLTTLGTEPLADITVKASRLIGINIPENLVSLAIDEFPVLFVAACCAYGRTTLTGAKELKVKESDRIVAMAEGLQRLGANVTVTDDGVIIEGLTDEKSEWRPVFCGSEVFSYHDHRVAMSFAVASVRAYDTIIVQGVETVNTSFPNFAELANSVGMNIAIRH